MIRFQHIRKEYDDVVAVDDLQAVIAGIVIKLVHARLDRLALPPSSEEGKADTGAEVSGQLCNKVGVFRCVRRQPGKHRSRGGNT